MDQLSSMDLLELRVLVTRPEPQGPLLCEQIERYHGKAIYFPVIIIEPPQDKTKLDQGIAKIDQQDWLIFISPQAVYACAEKIHTYWPKFPPKVRVAAVGQGTAQALKTANLPVDLYPADEWNSEGLLASEALSAIEGKKVTLFRGEGGRELLANVLGERGAKVSHVIAYRRSLPRVDVSSFVDLFQDGKIDVIVCSSGEGVQNLHILLVKEIGANLLDMPLVVVSERMKTLAESLGFQRIWVAKNASHGAMLNILAEIRKHLCQIK